MPDPKISTPVRPKQQGARWVLVDADGKRLDGQGSFPDRARAAKAAARINDAWAGAKAERRAKGAPALTEAPTIIAIHRTTFNPDLHPRDRLGRFTDVLRVLKGMRKHGAAIHLPSGHIVQKAYRGYQISKGGETKRFRKPEQAAKYIAQTAPRMQGRYDFSRLDTPPMFNPGKWAKLGLYEADSAD